MRRFRKRPVTRGIRYSLPGFGSSQTRPILHRSDTFDIVYFQRTWTIPESAFSLDGHCLFLITPMYHSLLVYHCDGHTKL